MTGTHKGEYTGNPGTGRSFTVPGTSISHIVGGKIKENWAYWDRLGLLEQLGVAPKKG
jgi:predicted ester cyclase